MIRNIIILIFLPLLLSSRLEAQQPYPKGYFCSPLDIPLFLAGNFGEIRPNHFHAGIDIKTMSEEGKKIYSAADGFVSRIKIQSNGYGKSLYITHPNGFTTVYGHLQKFSDTIEKYLRNEQYAQETFEIELYPAPHVFPVKQGDIVAYSGNTGGSSGPHLHFEVRDAVTEYAINPLLFGFEIKDSLRPLPTQIKIYPLGENSHVSGARKPKSFRVSGAYGNYTLGSAAIDLSGEIGIAAEVYDYLDGTHNRCGAYSLELLFDSQRIYFHEMERIGFHESRYINSHVDYVAFLNGRRPIQKCFIAPNNKLGIYKAQLNRGIISITDDSLHRVIINVKDAYGNTSVVSFAVRGKHLSTEEMRMRESLVSVEDENEDKGGTENGEEPDTTNELEKSINENEYLAAYSKTKKFMSHQNDNEFRNEDCRVIIPSGALYEDLQFEYAVYSDTLQGALAPTHYIHNENVPLHITCDIAIRASHIPDKMKEKALIAQINKSGGKNYAGGRWAGDFITAKTRSFGGYSVFVDVTPPYIKPLNIYEGKSMIGRWSIMIRIGDNLSGIASYRGEIDGKWVLMEYDAKNYLLIHNFEESLQKGQHRFKIKVTDNRGNEAVYEAGFYK